ncbi:MAG: hypothetical protein ABIQ44_15930 [Chloroflexia bacterium]
MKKVLILALSLLAVFGVVSFPAYAASSTVTLSAQNGSGQNGTVTLEDMGGGMTKVTVDISGGSTTPQPAHIHEGTCANLNPKPKYPLTSLVNGKSETMVDAPLAELANGEYAVNVHKSGPEAAVYVSCGNISALVLAGMPQTGAVSPLFFQTAALVFLALVVSALGWKMRRQTEN